MISSEVQCFRSLAFLFDSLSSYLYARVKEMPLASVKVFSNGEQAFVMETLWAHFIMVVVLLPITRVKMTSFLALQHEILAGFLG